MLSKSKDWKKLKLFNLSSASFFDIEAKRLFKKPHKLWDVDNVLTVWPNGSNIRQHCSMARVWNFKLKTLSRLQKSNSRPSTFQDIESREATWIRCHYSCNTYSKPYWLQARTSLPSPPPNYNVDFQASFRIWNTPVAVNIDRGDMFGGWRSEFRCQLKETLHIHRQLK